MEPTCAGGAGQTLHLHILGSGSKGNCALVEGPEGLIMIDDGLSRSAVLERMHALGLSESDVRALILTHEHHDHVSGVAVWCKHFDGELYASRGTPETRKYLSCLPFEEFDPGDAFEIAGVRVETFATSHDVVNPTGFRFSCRGDAIGYVTDTGRLSPDAMHLLSHARILALESNHDMQMLRAGPYPRVLQDRIASEHGHLSNAEAAGLLPQLIDEHAEQVAAMHLSQKNNRPSLAVQALAEAVGAEPDDEVWSGATLVREDGSKLHIQAASQEIPMTLM